MSQFDETVDVLVVGSGAAGCAAGASAARAGAKRVLICEASDKMVGGTTRLAGGGWLWVPNNPFLKELGVNQPAAEIVALLKDLAYPNGETPDANDVALMRVFAEEWPGICADILRAGVMNLRPVEVREKEDGERVLGMLRQKQKQNAAGMKHVGITEANIEKLAGLMPSYCGEHPMDLCPSGKVLAPDGSTSSKQLEAACRKQYGQACEIRMGARVVDVVFELGRVVGAVVVTNNAGAKKQTRIRALGGVVFASGGFGQNKAMLAREFGPLGPFGSCAARTNVGDFVDIARRYNIPVSGMDSAWMKQVVLPYKFPKRLGVFFCNGDSYMIVDRTGNRFACDRDFYQQRGEQMRQREDRRCVFFVFDERVWQACEGPIKGLGSAYPMLEGDEDCVVKGASAAELTAGIRSLLTEVCPGFELDKAFASSLEAQLARFNAMAVTGRDTEFGRGDNVPQYCWSVPRLKDNPYPNKTMYPINTKQLRCVILGLSVLDTKGGPSIDGNGQVLSAKGTPVPGLYGAGNAVRSFTRKSYPASGVTISSAVLFGWKAGEHAAKQAKGAKL